MTSKFRLSSRYLPSVTSLAGSLAGKEFLDDMGGSYSLPYRSNGYRHFLGDPHVHAHDHVLHGGAARLIAACTEDLCISAALACEPAPLIFEDPEPAPMCSAAAPRISSATVENALKQQGATAAARYDYDG